jgi:hypothetical protein
VTGHLFLRQGAPGISWETNFRPSQVESGEYLEREVRIALRTEANGRKNINCERLARWYLKLF